MGIKLIERATGEVWTLVGDGDGHSRVLDEYQPERPPTAYRIRSESTGEVRMISSNFSGRYDRMI